MHAHPVTEERRRITPCFRGPSHASSTPPNCRDARHPCGVYISVIMQPNTRHFWIRTALGTRGGVVALGGCSAERQKGRLHEAEALGSTFFSSCEDQHGRYPGGTKKAPFFYAPRGGSDKTNRPPFARCHSAPGLPVNISQTSSRSAATVLGVR